MNKKVALGILLSLLVFFISSPINVLADGKMVSEWLVDDESPTTQLDNNAPDDKEINQNVPTSTDHGSLVFNVIKLVFALFLILALIYLLLKFLNKRNKVQSKVKALENLGGIAVGPNKSIQIVRVGHKLFLVGVGENVQLLEEIEDEVLKEEIFNSNEHQSQVKGGNFLSVFQQNMNTADNKSNNLGDFKKMFSGELEKLKQNRKKLMNNNTVKEDNDG